MIKDKLSHDERLRLECLNQAISLAGRTTTSEFIIVSFAAEFEKYVRGIR